MRGRTGPAILFTPGALVAALLTPGASWAASTSHHAHPPLSVFVGYADTLRADATHFPTPWDGAPRTVFIGSGSPLDAGAIRIVNRGRKRVAVHDVSVDLHHGADGGSGPVFALWGSFTIPGRGEAILTQTGPPRRYDFDTSDFPFEPAGTPAPASDPRIPAVTITVRGRPLRFRDTGHVLDTRGFDTNLLFRSQVNESAQWTSIGRTSCKRAMLLLTPNRQRARIGHRAKLTATLTNGCGEPLDHVRIRFRVLSGPRAGTSASAVTGAKGKARFRFSAPRTGTSRVRASVRNPAGRFSSRKVSVRWHA